MNTKNIVLIVICVISAFFIVRSLFKIGGTSDTTFSQEKIKCHMITEWLKTKKVSSCVFYGNHDTLANILEKESFRIDNSIPFEPERKLGDFIKLASVKGIKCIVFIDFFRPEDSINEFQDYLKSGGIVFIKNFNDSFFENSPLSESILEYIKKGQISLILPKIADSDTRNMSNEKKVLAENDFIDSSNFIKFETAFKDFTKRKEEFMNKNPNMGR